jgi:hypothetical protein
MWDDDVTARDILVNVTIEEWIVLRWQLEEQEVGVRCQPACENMSLEAEEHPLLEDFTK